MIREGKIFPFARPEPPKLTPLTPENVESVRKVLQHQLAPYDTRMVFSAHFMDRLARPEHHSPVHVEDVMSLLGKLPSIRRFQQLLLANKLDGEEPARDIMARDNATLLKIPMRINPERHGPFSQKLVAMTVFKNHGLVTPPGTYDSMNTFDVNPRSREHDVQDNVAIRMALKRRRDAERLRGMDRPGMDPRPKPRI